MMMGKCKLSTWYNLYREGREALTVTTDSCCYCCKIAAVRNP
jgi:hypothetical protein